MKNEGIAKLAGELNAARRDLISFEGTYTTEREKLERTLYAKKNAVESQTAKLAQAIEEVHGRQTARILDTIFEGLLCNQSTAEICSILAKEGSTKLQEDGVKIWFLDELLGKVSVDVCFSLALNADTGAIVYALLIKPEADASNALRDALSAYVKAKLNDFETKTGIHVVPI